MFSQPPINFLHDSACCWLIEMLYNTVCRTINQQLGGLNNYAMPGNDNFTFCALPFLKK